MSPQHNMVILQARASHFDDQLLDFCENFHQGALRWLQNWVSYQPLESPPLSSAQLSLLHYHPFSSHPLSLFFPPIFTSPPSLRNAHENVYPSAIVPLIYAGLRRANGSLTFCLAVQRMLFPEGSIKIWYSASQGKGAAELQSG